MIKVLAFCAALLAPDSTGLDPHGRSLHLKLYTDFNTSYTACITTVKQAHKYGVDPFVLAAVMYDVTGMAPERAGQTHITNHLFEIHGCEKQGQFIKSSCSAYMLAAPYFAKLLNQTIRESDRQQYRFADYRKALCHFYAAGEKCESKHQQKVKLIENIAQRYADLYSRTHTSFKWHSPFLPMPTQEEMLNLEAEKNYRNRRGGMANGCGTGDPILDELVGQLGYASRCNLGDYRIRMNKGLSLISSLLGQNIHLEANTIEGPGGIVKIEYVLSMSYKELKGRLKHVSGLKINNVSVLGVSESPNQNFVINMQSYSSQVRMEFYRQIDKIYLVSIHRYQ